MRRTITLTVLAGALAALAGCSSNTVQTVWQDPTVTSPLKKVVVASSSTDEGIRRAVEDGFVKQCQSVKNPVTQAVAAYTIYPTLPAPADSAKIAADLAAQGFDGVVVFRFLGANQETSYVPGGGVGYYGYYGWAGAYDPGYYMTTTTAYVSTTVYGLKGTPKMIYMARGQSFDPSNAMSLVNGQVAAAYAQLNAAKLIN